VADNENGPRNQSRLHCVLNDGIDPGSERFDRYLRRQMPEEQERKEKTCHVRETPIG
jgi:hypothetical protein